MKEKSLPVEKFFDHGKILGLSLLKMKSYNKKMLVLKPLKYILLNQEQKHLFALMSTPQK